MKNLKNRIKSAIKNLLVGDVEWHEKFWLGLLREVEK